MIFVKIRCSNTSELDKLTAALQSLGLSRRGGVKFDGFSFYAKFTIQNDEKTKG